MSFTLFGSPRTGSAKGTKQRRKYHILREDLHRKPRVLCHVPEFPDLLDIFYFLMSYDYRARLPRVSSSHVYMNYTGISGLEEYLI